MISVILESYLRTANPTLITESFLWIIAIIFIIAVGLRKRGLARSFVNYTATLLTTLGILGTFKE